MSDAEVLERAAAILRGRSIKPHSFWLNVVCRMLERAATRIRLAGG